MCEKIMLCAERLAMKSTTVMNMKLNYKQMPSLSARLTRLLPMEIRGVRIELSREDGTAQHGHIVEDTVVLVTAFNKINVVRVSLDIIDGMEEAVEKEQGKSVASSVFPSLHTRSHSLKSVTNVGSEVSQRNCVEKQIQS